MNKNLMRVLILIAVIILLVIEWKIILKLLHPILTKEVLYLRFFGSIQ